MCPAILCPAFSCSAFLSEIFSFPFLLPDNNLSEYCGVLADLLPHTRVVP